MMDSILQKITAYPKTTGAIVGIGLPVAYLIYFHRSLASQVEHKIQRGTAGDLKQTLVEEQSPSVALLAEAKDDCPAIYDRAWKSVPTRSLPPDLDHDTLLTMYLRRTMTLFSTRMPQAYIIRLMVGTPELKKSFEPSVIQSLAFQKGDVVNGGYRVASRISTNGLASIEFAMEMPVPTPVQGRLIIAVERTADLVTFSSETVMWKPANFKDKMPLETPLIKWLHELASWWLILKGSHDLMLMKRND